MGFSIYRANFNSYETACRQAINEGNLLGARSHIDDMQRVTDVARGQFEMADFRQNDATIRELQGYFRVRPQRFDQRPSVLVNSNNANCGINAALQTLAQMNEAVPMASPLLDILQRYAAGSGDDLSAEVRGRFFNHLRGQIDANEVLGVLLDRVQFRGHTSLLTPTDYNGQRGRLAFAPGQEMGDDLVISIERNTGKNKRTLRNLFQKRFVMEKDHTPLEEIPLELATHEARYELTGGTIHLGNANGGHFVRVSRVERHWYLCNDNRISPLDEREALRRLKGAVNLTYRKPLPRTVARQRRPRSSCLDMTLRGLGLALNLGFLLGAKVMSLGASVLAKQLAD